MSTAFKTITKARHKHKQPKRKASLLKSFRKAIFFGCIRFFKRMGHVWRHACPLQPSHEGSKKYPYRGGVSFLW